MEKEIWKDCVGYEGLYQVSNLGRVRRLSGEVQRKYKNRTEIFHINGGILKPRTAHNGQRIDFWKNGVRRAVKIHILVLEAFVGKRPIGHEACHFPDNSYANNRLDNLRWDTKENNERDKKYIGTVRIGEKHPCAKITNYTARKIKEMLLHNRMIYISNTLNVSYSIVNQIKRGDTWRWLKV